ncbi:MAG: sialate O-acetylesterase [Bacteroidota bacterium]
MSLSLLSKRGLLLLLLFNNLISYAQLQLPAIFSHYMVVQRDKPLNVWGKADAGKEVTVIFSSQKKTTTADGSGNWNLTLDPPILSIQPQDLIIESGTSITFHNILVGDVWLCTGQSNMEYPMDRKLKKYAAPQKGADTAELELKKSTRMDAVRYLYVEKNLDKMPALPTKGWVGGTDTMLKYVSAIGYFFAKEVYEKTKIPIGIISSSWGGTRIEEWTPDWAYKKSRVFKDSATITNFKIDGMHPGQKYNGMILPLIPFAIKGVLWYQGESNCMIEDQATYPDKFELFVKTWRNLFKDDELPFYYVQIAPFFYTNRNDAKKHSAGLLPEFWEAQSRSLSLSNAAMAVTTDLVDNLSDIHPSYKWEVAHRLALIALVKDYKKDDLEYSGPVYQSMKKSKTTIQLTFSHSTGLKSNDGKELNWFSVAGKDGVFMPAIATIKDDQIIISNPEVKKPKQVRFAWNETAQPNLVNAAGLPAAPFRTKR